MSQVLARSLAIVVLVALLVPGDGSAQRLTGRVVFEGWSEPAAGARVMVLDTALMAVDSARAGADGAFAFDRLRPGAYYLQVELGGVFSPLSDAVHAEAGVALDLTVTLPSPVLELALGCFEENTESGTGVLVGIAHEEETGAPLPQARVQLQWRRDGEAVTRVDTYSDADGRFRFCSVPAGVPVSAWVQALGRVRHAAAGLQVEELAITRSDLALRLADPGMTIEIAETGPPEPGSETSTLAGRVVDAESERPISHALIRLGSEVPIESITDAEGRFRMELVPAGVHVFQLRHIGYGDQTDSLHVPGGARLDVAVWVPPRAVELGGLTVAARTRSEPAGLGEGRSMNVLEGERLAFARDRGLSVPDLVGMHFVGVSVEEGWFSTADHPDPRRIACVQARRGPGRLETAGEGFSETDPANVGGIRINAPGERPGGATQQFCEMVSVYVDGINISFPGETLLMMDLSDIERVELLSPREAGIRFGADATRGVLLLWTRRGRDPGPPEPRVRRP